MSVVNKFNVDFGKINEEAEKMNSSGGDYFNQSEIKDGSEVTIRVVPPLPSLNGLYYLKQYSIWINGVNYISPKTFGKPCPIIDGVEEIHKGGDDDLKAMIDMEGFSIKEDYLLPILLLKPEFKGNVLKDVEVVDEKIKIFKCTFSVVKGINNIMNSRHYQNDSPLGIMDPEIGHNLDISKHIKNKRTNYDVAGWPKPYAIDEAYYEEVPDIVEKVQKKIYSYEYLEGVFNNYLYNEDMPDDKLKFSDRPQSEVKGKTSQTTERKTSVKPSTTKTEESTGTKTMSLAERLKARRDGEGK